MYDALFAACDMRHWTEELPLKGCRLLGCSSKLSSGRPALLRLARHLCGLDLALTKKILALAFTSNQSMNSGTSTATSSRLASADREVDSSTARPRSNWRERRAHGRKARLQRSCLAAHLYASPGEAQDRRHAAVGLRRPRTSDIAPGRRFETRPLTAELLHLGTLRCWQTRTCQSNARIAALAMSRAHRLLGTHGHPRDEHGGHSGAGADCGGSSPSLARHRRASTKRPRPLLVSLRTRL